MKSRVYYSKHLDIELAYDEISNRAKKEFDSYDFVIIAVSPIYEMDKLLEITEERFKSKYVMFHAVDAFCNEDIIEGIVALFIKFEREGDIELFYQDNVSTNTQKALDETISYLQKHNTKDSFHIMITGECNKTIASFISQIGQSNLDLHNIQGGVSSGIEENEQIIAYQFCDNKIIKDGFIIVTFKNIVSYNSISMGFTPVGINYTITKSDIDSIYTLDYSPISEIVKRLVDGIEDFEFEYLYYTPLVILDESDEELLTLRTFRRMEDEYVKVWGNVKNGQKVRLAYGESETLLDADKESANRVWESLPNPELILNFSCIARRYVLEESFERENSIYIERFNAPLFGFFTFGEIGNSSNKHSLQFFNETSLLSVLKEK